MNTEVKETYLIVWYNGNEYRAEILLCTDTELQRLTNMLSPDIQVLLPLHHDYTDTNNVDWNPKVFVDLEWRKIKELPMFDWGVL